VSLALMARAPVCAPEGDPRRNMDAKGRTRAKFRANGSCVRSRDSAWRRASSWSLLDCCDWRVPPNLPNPRPRKGAGLRVRKGKPLMRPPLRFPAATPSAVGGGDPVRRPTWGAGCSPGPPARWGATSVPLTSFLPASLPHRVTGFGAVALRELGRRCHLRFDRLRS